MLYGNLNRKRGFSLYGDPIKPLYTIPANQTFSKDSSYKYTGDPNDSLTYDLYQNRRSNESMGNQIIQGYKNTDSMGGYYEQPSNVQNPAAQDRTNANTDTEITGLAPSVLNNSFSNQPIPEKPGESYGFDDMAGDGGVNPAGGLSGKIPNYNALAYASLLPAVGQSIKDITASADRTPLTLANFNEAGSRFDKMSSNLTQAKQDTLASSNAQQFQIDQSSTGGLRNARLQGANVSYRDALGRVAANEQQLRNQVLQTQGQAETNFATDEANRKTQNITFNEQNKAVTEDIRRQASQNIFNLVGQNANNRQMFEDIKANNLTLQKASTAEGFKFLEMMAQNFGMGGAEEYQAYLEDPNNPEKLKKLMDSFQIKFKEYAPEEPAAK